MGHKETLGSPCSFINVSLTVIILICDLTTKAIKMLSFVPIFKDIPAFCLQINSSLGPVFKSNYLNLKYIENC